MDEPKETRVLRLAIPALAATLIALALALPALASADFSLTVQTEGSGAGSWECEVEEGPAEPCEAEYPAGTELVVLAEADPGSEFVEFHGDCGPLACYLTMDEDHTAIAVFEAEEVEALALTIEEGGIGSGIVQCKVEGGLAEPCEAEYPEGTALTLIAKADPGSEFVEWGGECDSVTGDECELTMDEEKAVEVVFELVPAEFALNVEEAGSGSGTVRCKVEGGLAEPCEAEYPEGTALTLIAEADAGSEFVEWGGECDLAIGDECEVEMREARTVAVIFALKPSVSLTVNLAGAGEGKVECKVNGGSLEGCEAEYPEGTGLALVAKASPGSEFAGYSAGTGSAAACSASPCAFTIEADSKVTATFDLKAKPKFKLTVSRSGAGTVTSVPAGISCGVTCSAEFEEGKEVELKEAPEAGSEFVKWSGACTGSGACKVTMTSAKEVGAEFKPAPKPKFKLTVSKSGSGTGTVTSTPAGISCNAACNAASAEFEEGVKVALKAEAAAGSQFVKWSGACSGSGTCEVTMSAAKEATAEFKLLPKPKFKLTVSKSGAGTVASSPTGINCGSTCAAEFEAGTAVTLTASPPAGQGVSWSGCDSVNGKGQCLVTMNAARTIGASFEALVPLEVLEPGGGEGTVTSSPAGIECGSICSAGFLKGQLVTLTASSAPHTKAVKWAGCDAVAKDGKCQVTMSAAKTVIATFELERQWLEYQVTVQRKGTGQGTVTSVPGGIECGEDCSEAYLYGTQVTLTATPAPGSVFKEWSGGGCLGQSGPCTTAVNGTRLIRAIFVAVGNRALTVSKAGTGQGTVTSKAAGIDCGSVCSVELDASTMVVLHATPAAGSTFAGWSGEGCVGTGACRVLMNEARNVTATFTKPPGPPSSAGTLSVGGSARVKGGKAMLHLACNGAGPCQGALKLIVKIKGSNKGLVIASSPYSLTAGGSQSLAVRLSHRALDLLGSRDKPLKARVSGIGAAHPTIKLMLGGAKASQRRAT